MSSCKLSVLVPSTYNREIQTEILLHRLRKMFKPYDAEVVVCYDNKEMSIGAKRQKMLEEANGEYVVSIDSDDDVKDYYADELFKAFENNPDCVGFEIEVKGMRGKLASASNMWPRWENKRVKHKARRYDYTRTPYHKTPIKREIALQIGFPDKRYAEDIDFSNRLKESGLIKTELYIQKPMYIYKYEYEDKNTKYGYDRDGLNTE